MLSQTLSQKMGGIDVLYDSSDKHEYNLVLEQMFYSFCLGHILQLFIVLKAFLSLRSACFDCLSIFPCIIDECGCLSASTI